VNPAFFFTKHAGATFCLKRKRVPRKQTDSKSHTCRFANYILRENTTQKEIQEKKNQQLVMFRK
jgi:hypothetical protein